MAELVAIRTVALQNRLALDFLLAKEGGTCAIIGQECCTYIPGSSDLGETSKRNLVAGRLD